MAYNILKSNPFGGNPPDGYFLAWNNVDGYWEARPGPSGSFSAGGDLAGNNSSQIVVGIQGRTVLNTTPADNNVLTWVAANNRWEFLPAQGGAPTGGAGGDLSGTYPNPIVSKLQTRTVNPVLPDDGQVLTYITADGYWAPRAPAGGAPSGVAGGDLGGTYPNPTVVALQGNDVFNEIPSDGYVLTWLNSDGYWAARPTASAVPDATTLIKGKIQLAGDLGGTADAPAVLRINGATVDTAVANRVLVGISPTQTAWSEITDGYVSPTANIAGSKISSATVGALGVIQLAGDLSGSATGPTVIAIQNYPIDDSAPADGYVLTWIDTDGYWAPRAGGVFVPDATDLVKGKLRLTNDLGGTADAPLVTGLQSYDVDDTLPTDGYVLTWIDADGYWAPRATTEATPDATTLIKGKIQLAGDLGGTASIPLVLKINGTDVPSGPSANQMLVAVSGTSSIWSQIFDGYISPSANIAGSKIAAATMGSFGVIQLDGDLGGTGASPLVTGLQGFDVDDSTPTDGYVLTWVDADGYWAARESTGGGGTPDATDSVKGKLKLTNDLGGTADLPLVTGLQSFDVHPVTPTDGYVLTWLSDGYWAPRGLTIPDATPDATNSVKGKLKLAGDLGGTADLPSVLKINGTSVPATPSANEILVATNGTNSVWSQIYDGYVAPTANIAGSKITSASAGAFGVIQLTGDLGGTAASPSVINIRGNQVANEALNSSRDGYVLTWSNTDGYWVSRPAAGGSPSGAAGGDLSGTYPNPTVAKIQNRSVSAAMPQDGYALVWNAAGSNWVPSSLSTTTNPAGWQGVYEVDFANLSTQAFSGNGSVIIDGLSWTVENFASATSFGIINGDGLRFSCNTTNADYNNGTRNSLLIGIPVQNIFPSFDIEKHEVRILCQFTHNADQSFEHIFAGYEHATSPTQQNFLLGRGFNAGSGGAVYAIKETLTASSANPTDTANLTDDVIIVEMKNINEFMSRSGTYSGGWPSNTNLRRVKLFTTAGDLPFEKSSDAKVVFTAITANSNGNFVATIKKFRMEIRTKGGGFTANVGSNNYTKLTNLLSNQPGPVGNWTANYVSSGGNCMIMASLSAYSSNSTTSHSFNLQVDGNTVDTKTFFFNNANVHHTFSSTFYVGALSAGNHTISLQAVGAVQTNSDDFIDLSIIESVGSIGTAGGDLTGIYPNPTVARIQGRLVNPSAPPDGYALVWSQADGYWKPGQVSSSGASGSAGGDLSGTYPNPTVAKLQTRSVNNAAPADGYVLTWSESDGYWAARAVASIGGWTNIGLTDVYTARSVSLDPNGTPATARAARLFVNGNQQIQDGYLAIASSADTISSTQGFTWTSDSAQNFVVPAGIFSLTVKMWGPGGGSGNYSGSGGGGAGGYASGTLSVTPGETLLIVPGSGGKAPVSSNGNGGNGGWPGGGYGTRGDASGGGGGGLSGIFTGSVSQANALIIAGGGGGSTGFGNFGAGGGGGTSGGSGTSNSGGGGSQIAGGLGGSGQTSPPVAGSALQGGVAFSDQTTSQGNDCGGGGSGYWGGGAGQGDGRAGGGGSGYLHPSRITNGVLTAGNNAAGGNVANNPPNTSDSLYVAGKGVGAQPGQNGGDGYVWLSWAGPKTLLKNESLTFREVAGISVNNNGRMTLFDGYTSKPLTSFITDGYTASGDLSGTYPAPTVAKIRNVNVSNTTPTDQQFLAYDLPSTSWVPRTVLTQYARRIAPDGYTQVYWNMNEGSSPFLNTGAAGTLDLTSGSYGTPVLNATGLFGNAVDFQSAGLKTADTSVGESTSQLTVSAWIYCRSFPASSEIIGKKYQTGNTWSPPYTSWALGFSGTSGVLYANITISGTSYSTTTSTRYPVLTNQWTLVAFTFNSTTNQVLIYVNGQLAATSAGIPAGVIDYVNHGSYHVGAVTTQSTQGIDGRIDEIRIENTVRSRSYFENMYKNGIAQYESPSVGELTGRPLQLAQYHDTTHNPLGLWQFNGNLNDSSGNGKTLSVGAGTARYGDISPQLKGLYFDGSTRVQITDASFRLVGDMTIEMLVFIQTIGANTAPILISCMDSGETNTTNYLYSIYAVNPGYFLQYFYETGAGNNFSYSNTTGSIPMGEVFHLAMVRQSNVVSFYINGKLNGAASSTLTSPDTPGTQILYIGGNVQDVSFTGALASVKIINSALSQPQIEAEYNRTLGNLYGKTAVNVQVNYDVVLMSVSGQLASTTKLALVNSTSGAVTVTLPADPVLGEWHKIKDSAGTAGTNNITISGNGKNIEQFTGSPAGSLILNSSYDAVELVYNGTSWNII